MAAHEWQFDDICGQRCCAGCPAAIGGAGIAVLRIAVVAELQGRIDHTVSAARKRTVLAAERIGNIAVQRAFITLLPCIQTRIAAVCREIENGVFGKTTVADALLVIRTGAHRRLIRSNRRIVDGGREG